MGLIINVLNDKSKATEKDMKNMIVSKLKVVSVIAVVAMLMGCYYEDDNSYEKIIEKTFKAYEIGDISTLLELFPLEYLNSDGINYINHKFQPIAQAFENSGTNYKINYEVLNVREGNPSDVTDLFSIDTNIFETILLVECKMQIVGKIFRFEKLDTIDQIEKLEMQIVKINGKWYLLHSFGW